MLSMGRIEQSKGLAPPAIRKDARSKQARNIINKIIPGILAGNARARKAVEESQLIGESDILQFASAQTSPIDDPKEYVKRKGQGKRKLKTGFQESSDSNRVDDGKKRQSSVSASPPDTPKTEMKIRILNTDTITAASILASESSSKKKRLPNVCVLNMASPLRPGGGVLNGATSQEEFLCSRTTLYPSLKEQFYRLPEVGGILTRDVLVFRGPGQLNDTSAELSTSDRFWIDVISSAMLRLPELEGEDEECKRWSRKDCELAEKKMTAVLKIACQVGAEKLVLGAWGCGAYGNPVVDVAQAWKRVLYKSENGLGLSDIDSSWNISDVVVAITSKKMACDFGMAFDRKIEVESVGQADAISDTSDDHPANQELLNKIDQLESQIAMARNSALKDRLEVVLDSLKSQLGETDEPRKDHDSSDEEDDEGSEDKEDSMNENDSEELAT